MKKYYWGLIVHNKHLAWQMEGGHLRWLPMTVREWLVDVWNKIACALFGHNLFGPIPVEDEVDEETGKPYHLDRTPLTCSDCCREFDENNPPRYYMWIK